MNPADARNLLLVRAFEDPPVAPWSTTDAAWASDEATRAEGEAAEPEAWLARRARIAATRLAERDATVATALVDVTASRWIGGVLVALAFVAGVAIDRVGGEQRINILAPPLLALLAWNLAVYALLALRVLPRLAARPFAMPFARKHDAPSPVLGRFAAEWARLRQPLAAARLASALHAAAAALALGALASLYLRGLAFEYLAGWDSTFLDAADVHRLLSIVLGPASRLGGIALPDVEALAALRFSNGAGENAARWIHWHALTIGLAVVLPRALLAASSAWRARRLAADIALPLHEPYFRRLLRMQRGEPTAVQVVPYSYALQRDALPALQAVLEDKLGARVALRVADTVAQGHEDDLRGLSSAAATVALFALTATPERESHGAFIDALSARSSAAERLIVLVDESAFRRRFGEDARLMQRRDAWRKLLQDQGRAPLFADLAPSR